MDCKYPQSFKYEKIQKELSILPSHISFNQKFIDYGEVSIPKSLWKKYPILRTQNVYQDFRISKIHDKARQAFLVINLHVPLDSDIPEH